MTKNRFAFFGTCAFTLTVTLLVPIHDRAMGAIESKLKQESKDLRVKLDSEREALLNAEVKKRGILGALYDINKELGRINNDIESVQAQLDNRKKTIESYAKVIVRLEKIRDSQKEKLRRRLRALYKMGLRGYAEVLLSSQTSAEFSRNMKFMKIVVEKDHSLITNYKLTLDQLSTEQAKLRGQIKTYAQFEKQLEHEKAKFDDQHRRQIYLLTQIDQDRESHMQAIKEWREAGKKLEVQLAELGLKSQFDESLTRAAFFEQRGLLKLPVPREIIQKYGILKNERFNTKIFHKGLFFAAHPKDKVAAVYWGKVAFAGWIDGYGQTIILDHGDHYYSLYAHNSLLEKKAGETVSTGEVIALAGDTGSLRGPGLYMEIRHFSESLDPLPWLDLAKATRL